MIKLILIRKGFTKGQNYLKNVNDLRYFQLLIVIVIGLLCHLPASAIIGFVISCLKLFQRARESSMNQGNIVSLNSSLHVHHYYLFHT